MEEKLNPDMKEYDLAKEERNLIRKQEGLLEIINYLHDLVENDMKMYVRMGIGKRVGAGKNDMIVCDTQLGKIFVEPYKEPKDEKKEENPQNDAQKDA